MYSIMQKSTLLIYVSRHALKAKSRYYKHRLVRQNNSNTNSYSLLMPCSVPGTKIGILWPSSLCRWGNWDARNPGRLTGPASHDSYVVPAESLWRLLESRGRPLSLKEDASRSNMDVDDQQYSKSALKFHFWKIPFQWKCHFYTAWPWVRQPEGSHPPAAAFSLSITF